MTIADRASSMVAFTRHHVDRAVPPEHRQAAWEKTNSFAAERPLLFAFLLVQATFALFPLLLFGSFAASVILFAFGAAVLFALFWIGLALLVLVPILLIGASVAACVWVWGVAAFLALRWLYNLLPEGAAYENGYAKENWQHEKSGTAPAAAAGEKSEKSRLLPPESNGAVAVKQEFVPLKGVNGAPNDTPADTFGESIYAVHKDSHNVGDGKIL